MVNKNKTISKEEMIEAWTGTPFSKEIQKEAENALNLYKKGKSDPEVEAFTIPLEFGTGGIRGVLGSGVGRMNEYTVGRAALGLSRYLVKKFKNPTIVIAYDSRRKSKIFCEVTAGIAAANGIKVKVFPIETPTPLLSYAIRHYKAQGGVVITASHNPPQYNGF
ncbi:MAG: phospho-sugar mutase, partial [Leptospiraceae bacterium]|nr:phospho-sugar mutase [Leptospiraceae bacterium]